VTGRTSDASIRFRGLGRAKRQTNRAIAPIGWSCVGWVVTEYVLYIRGVCTSVGCGISNPPPTHSGCCSLQRYLSTSHPSREIAKVLEKISPHLPAGSGKQGEDNVLYTTKCLAGIPLRDYGGISTPCLVSWGQETDWSSRCLSFVCDFKVLFFGRRFPIGPVSTSNM
jgi:hypothetical protein